jgi:threonyl-tRNA synthetase
MMSIRLNSSTNLKMVRSVFMNPVILPICAVAPPPDTSPIKAVKLLNIAGAYWRGDVNRKQLTSIYGISFPKQKELTEYLEMLEEAKKRDHRK